MPVYNEAARVAYFVERACALLKPGHELWVVDGGSNDGTVSILHSLQSQGLPFMLLQSAKGRAAQMNAGAMQALGQALLFLHADTEIPAASVDTLVNAIEHTQGSLWWGRFNVRIVGQSLCLPMVAWFMNQRSRWTRIATGDQALFCSRTLFEQTGGFPSQPLMEDIDWCARARRVPGAVFMPLKAQVLTSGRRWDDHGAWRTIVLMWSLRLRYFLGESVESIAQRYRDAR
nr:TIGR04283 family arsenosugar biosynthesis glycosyltransferase [Limnobacter humi]